MCHVVAGGPCRRHHLRRCDTTAHPSLREAIAVGFDAGRVRTTLYKDVYRYLHGKAGCLVPRSIMFDGRWEKEVEFGRPAYYLWNAA